MAKIKEILPKELRPAAAAQNFDLCEGEIGQKIDQLCQPRQSVVDAVTEENYTSNLEDLQAAALASCSNISAMDSACSAIYCLVALDEPVSSSWSESILTC